MSLGVISLGTVWKILTNKFHLSTKITQRLNTKKYLRFEQRTTTSKFSTKKKPHFTQHKIQNKVNKIKCNDRKNCYIGQTSMTLKNWD